MFLFVSLHIHSTAQHLFVTHIENTLNLILRNNIYLIHKCTQYLEILNTKIRCLQFLNDKSCYTSIFHIYPNDFKYKYFAIRRTIFINPLERWKKYLSLKYKNPKLHTLKILFLEIIAGGNITTCDIAPCLISEW